MNTVMFVFFALIMLEQTQALPIQQSTSLNSLESSIMLNVYSGSFRTFNACHIIFELNTHTHVSSQICTP